MKRLKRENKKFTFGGHNTFPLRFSWFPRAIEELKSTPDLFKDTNRELAMQKLGLGSNMVIALKYWLEVTQLVNFDVHGSTISSLGHTLFGEQGDPFLEDETTLWILHWLITSNGESATGFFWFFNEFTNPNFDEKILLKALLDFNNHHLGIKRSESTLKSDLSTLLRMYAPSRRTQSESLNSPFISLGLIDSFTAGFNSMRKARPLLPAVVIHFTLQSISQQRNLATISMPELLHKSEGWPNIGGIFRLDETGLMEVMQRVISFYPDYYKIDDTAGLNQLLIHKHVPQPEEVLNEYYQKGKGKK